MQRPLPDEFVSSAWSRSCRAANLPITRLTQAVLQRKHAPGFFQSGHLEQLATIFDMPLAQLVQDHTVLPYAVAFYGGRPHAQAISIVGRSGVDARALGAVTQTVSDAVPWRRFCPDCAGSDCKNHGLSYWHRSHNLPGVVVCTLHKRPLQATTFAARGRRTWTNVLPHEVGEHSPAAPTVTQTLLDVASWSQLVLSRDYRTRLDSSPEKYRARLVESGALSASRDLCTRTLIAWAQRALRKELPYMLANSRDRSLAWLPLMFRPGTNIDMTALKHVLTTKLVELAKELPQSALDFRPTGLSARRVTEEDKSAAERLGQLVLARGQAGLRLGVQEALETIGIWAQFRHDRSRYEALNAAVRGLRRSPVAARRARRRHARG